MLERYLLLLQLYARKIMFLNQVSQVSSHELYDVIVYLILILWKIIAFIVYGYVSLWGW
jgi:hypothetical protein